MPDRTLLASLHTIRRLSLLQTKNLNATPEKLLSSVHSQRRRYSSSRQGERQQHRKGEHVSPLGLAGHRLFRSIISIGFMASATGAVAALHADARRSKPSPAAAGNLLEGVEVVLYQYETCPFCNKVRAYLDFRNIPYRAVEVNPLYKHEIDFSKDYRKVPIAVVDGRQINGSSEIIDSLEDMIAERNRSATIGRLGVSEDDSAEQRRWRDWVDSRFVHMLSPNIYRTPSEALQAFEYMTSNGNFSAWQRESARYFGAVFMYLISFKLRKKHGITDERKDLYAEADKWADNLRGRPFLGGDSPSLADVSMFGVIRAIQGLDAWRDLLKHSAIRPWYERMEAVVGGSSRLPEATKADVHVST